MPSGRGTALRVSIGARPCERAYTAVAMSSAEQRLRGRIAEAGPVTFAVFMEEALYGAGGYYDRPELPISEQGDYVTGPALSPLFGRATARLLRRLDETLGGPADYLEVGYGNADHLEDLLRALPPAPGRRLLAHDRCRRPVPPGVDRLDELERLGPAGVRGLIFSYELFDALPVHRLIRRQDGSLGELWVGLGPDGAFRYEIGELSDPGLAALLGQAPMRLERGQVADLSPAWGPLYRRLARSLEGGLLVTCDFGFERQGLLDPRARFHGTLACYRRHHVHRDALRAVGKQDLAAHVDFTTLRQQGEDAGLETVTLTRQASWLLACGLFDDLQGAERSVRLQAMTLLDPAGMGEEIRVLVQARGVEIDSLLDPKLLVGAGPGSHLDTSRSSSTQ